MSSIGWAEIVIVVVIALLVFGPKKLPDMGASLGRSIAGFKKGLRETKDEFQTAVSEESSSETAIGSPGSVSAAPAEELDNAASGPRPATTAVDGQTLGTETLTKTDEH